MDSVNKYFQLPDEVVNKINNYVFAARISEFEPLYEAVIELQPALFSLTRRRAFACYDEDGNAVYCGYDVLKLIDDDSRSWGLKRYKKQIIRKWLDELSC